MAYKPQITYNPQLSMEDNWKAATHWLNFLLCEMSVGRVPRTQKDTHSICQHQIQQDAALMQADETAIALFEAQLAQNEINRVQDEALIELYEIMEGA